MKARIKHIITLLLTILLLLSCAACGQKQTEQPEDTGDKDQYMTDPIPEGKPDPVEPQDTTVDTATTHTCTFSISCETILDNMDKCVENKKFLVPEDGIIFPATRSNISAPAPSITDNQLISLPVCAICLISSGSSPDPAFPPNIFGICIKMIVSAIPLINPPITGVDIKSTILPAFKK